MAIDLRMEFERQISEVHKKVAELKAGQQRILDILINNQPTSVSLAKTSGGIMYRISISSDNIEDAKAKCIKIERELADLYGKNAKRDPQELNFFKIRNLRTKKFTTE